MRRDRIVLGLTLGQWRTNCYVLGDVSAGRCVVVDPGQGSAERVPGLLADHDLACEAILLTHGHLDHIWGAPALARELDVPVLLHPDDRWLWKQPGLVFGLDPATLESTFGLAWEPADDHLEELEDRQKLSFAGLQLHVRHNPGHTPGHVTYLAPGLADADFAVEVGQPEAAEQVLFSGDLLFADGVGRTDLPRGSTEQMLRSLVDTVLPLEDDTLVLSGHGEQTTVGRERRANRFLQQARDRHGGGQLRG